MKILYIKQKLLSLGEKFTVKDESGKDVYFIEGSFLKIPKTFSIKNNRGEEVALITKKVFTFWPKFIVQVYGKDVITIKQQFSFIRHRYSIEGYGIEIKGDWLDMNFRVLHQGELVGTVSKKWFSWGDSYKVEITKEELEELMIAIVVAIDCVISDENATVNATTTP